MFHSPVHSDTPLHVPADAAARDALLSRVRTFAELDHARLVAVAEATVHSDNTLVVKWRGGQSTDLATVLAVRGRLSPAESAGVLVGVAQALAAMHSADLVHGPLSALDVMLDAGGEVRLQPRLDGAHDCTVADDVLAVASLVDGLLGPRTGDDDAATALRAVLAPALAPDPLVRPEAGTLAAWAHDAVAPEAVRLPEPATLAVAALGGARTPHSAPEPRVPTARHRKAYRGASAVGSAGRARTVARPRRQRAPGGPARRIGGLVAVIAVVGVLAGVAMSMRAPSSPPVIQADAAAVRAVSTSASASEHRADAVLDRRDPAAAAAALTERRLGLLTGSSGAPDRAALAAVEIEDSPAHAADGALVDRLTARGVELRGAEVKVHSAAAVEATDDRAEVTVEYEVGAYEQVSVGGESTVVPASGARTSRLSLVWTDAGWRVSEVS